jgi:7,8-dihydropterin-6-yl-methyl-4-(beta-D-ribofuranosyl)aminobenzene 5'-phosphate synthase
MLMRAFGVVPLVAVVSLAACGEVTIGSRPPSEAPPRSSVKHADGITNLYDAFTSRADDVTLDWGYSALVRYRGHTILFDSGDNATTLAHNAQVLGVDLREVDIAVLSHDHTDHSSGFDYLLAVNPAVKLYLPADGMLGGSWEMAVAAPAADMRAIPPERQYYRGARKGPRQTSGRYWKANVELVPKSREIVPGVTLVATESPVLGAFNKYPPHDVEPKLSGLAELSMVLETGAGDVVVVGCSHSGVEAIVKATKELRHRDVLLVIGGFHLFPYSEDEVRAVATRMHDVLGVKRVAPAHCTGHFGFQAFAATYGADDLFAGLGEEIAIPK